MKALLDTHVLLWMAGNEAKLSAKAKKLVLNPESELFCSIASLWELSIKISLQKLSLPCTLAKFVEEEILGNNINFLAIKPTHTYTLSNLPFHHRDPFDRLLIAQAMRESLHVVTADSQFAAYAIQCYW